MSSPSQLDHVQYFRATPTSTPVTVNVSYDQNTGERFIKWQDIKLAFGTVKKVLNGDEPVEVYSMDENGPVTPRRIKHHPGVILDVMLSANETPRHSITSANGNGQTIALHTNDNEPVSRPSTPLSTPPRPKKSSPFLQNNFNLPSSLSNRRVAQNQQAALFLPNLGSTRNVYTPQPLLMSPQGQMYCQQYNEVCNDYFEAMDLGDDDQARVHAEHALGIVDQIHHQFNKIFVEIEKNSNAQFDMVQIQKEIKRMQQEVLEMQRKALDQLVNMRDRVQAVLTQTYELHEYPIPRLFVVLPRQSTGFMGDLFSRKFRLYFLCECGQHTKTSKNVPPPEIHISDHPGYDLESPTEFFDKYGDYVMTMLQMLKFGCMAAGVVVPAIDTLKIVDGIQAVESRFGKMQFAPLVDETISLLQGVQKKSNKSEGASQNKSPFENVEVLEGAELRLLRDFLKVNDGERSLGNLYRIVTESGKVKWVCRDHYPSAYRAKSQSNSPLMDFIEAKNGEYTEGIGKIKVCIETPTEAKALYELLSKARGIQELDVKLNWDATKDDLKKLVVCLSSTKIACLYIDGKQFDGPTLDVQNRRRRFNQIVRLMSSSHIQSLTLSDFNRFYDRVTIDGMGTSNQLRVLSIGITNISGESHCKLVLTKILDKCSSLHSLELITTEAPHYLTRFLLTKYSNRYAVDTANANLSDKTITVTLDLVPAVVVGANFINAPTTSTFDTSCDVAVPSRPAKITTTIKSIDQSQECRKKIMAVYTECGYAIKELDTTWIFDDELSKNLSDVICKNYHSKLTNLQVDAWNLSTNGLNDLCRILYYQLPLKRFALVYCLLSDDIECAKLGYLRDIVRDKVTSLTFKGNTPTYWLPSVMKAIPNKFAVPRLDTLRIESRAQFPKELIPWIAGLLSKSLHHSRSWPNQSYASIVSRDHRGELDKCQPLKVFAFEAVELESKGWEMIIDALDFSTLQEISFWSSNFTLDALNHFIVRIEAMSEKIALKYVDLRGTKAANDEAMDERDHKLRGSQFIRLKSKVKDLVIQTNQYF
ncbi:hypothetical protein BGZ76_010400 [Entomortierella beljakovae]|nr:hypothetical protein BGZ76_010400 [Entomortierella beljakovae]